MTKKMKLGALERITTLPKNIGLKTITKVPKNIGLKTITKQRKLTALKRIQRFETDERPFGAFLGTFNSRE